MNTLDDTARPAGPGAVGHSEAERLAEAERLREIENGRRDVRANLFLAGMVGIGALTVLAAVVLGGTDRDSAATPGTSASLSAAR